MLHLGFGAGACDKDFLFNVRFRESSNYQAIQRQYHLATKLLKKINYCFRVEQCSMINNSIKPRNNVSENQNNILSSFNERHQIQPQQTVFLMCRIRQMIRLLENKLKDLRRKNAWKEITLIFAHRTFLIKKWMFLFRTVGRKRDTNVFEAKLY